MGWKRYTYFILVIIGLTIRPTKAQYTYTDEWDEIPANQATQDAYLEHEISPVKISEEDWQRSRDAVSRVSDCEGNPYTDCYQQITEAEDRPPPRTSSYEDNSVPMTDINASPVLGKIIMWVLAIVLAILIIVLFFRTPTKQQNTKFDPTLDLDEINPHEIPKTELELRLEDAISAKDYRKAIRIYFIFIIKELTALNWIKWEKRKTNFAYLREMTDNKHYNSFSESVSIFEIIWYGKREISLSDFKQIEPRFKSLVKQLESTKK